MNTNFKYLVIKDPHFMFGFRNNIRKHGWEKAIDSKINQIIDYARVNQVTNIFFTGDVFEKSHLKDWNFNQVRQNKKRFQMFRDAGLSIYSNMGNHDCFDGHTGKEGTVFGEMVDLGLMTYIGSSMKPIKFPLGEKTIGLFGVDYHQNKNVVLDELERISLFPDIDIKIALTHSNITDQNIQLTDFTYKQLSKYNIDIINCGHWHLQPAGGPIQEVNGTHFLNPWNLTRVMRDYNVKLDEHIPSFIHTCIALNEVDNTLQYEFKEIPLVVQPFSEAFNIDTINLLQELGKNNFQFFEEISLDQEEDMNDDSILIDNIVKGREMSKESIRIAKELIT